MRGGGGQGVGGGGGVDLNKLQYLLYIVALAGLSKQLDPDQTSQYAASDQGLHCLPFTQQFYSYSHVVKWTC